MVNINNDYTLKAMSTLNLSKAEIKISIKMTADTF